MRAAQVIRDFFEWRWAPFVGLTVGSLAYVGLAVLIIPSQIDGGAPASERSTAFNTTAALPNTAYASALTQSSFSTAPTVREPIHRAPPPPPPVSDPPRRGFSPPIEQPDPPPPPPPPPPPVQVAPMPTPQPVLNQPPAMPPPEQQTPSPTQPPPAQGDDSAAQPPAQPQ
jgi:outer membrane biosynthesis protein TonB